jgi:hypothetical protein
MLLKCYEDAFGHITNNKGATYISKEKLKYVSKQPHKIKKEIVQNLKGQLATHKRFVII